MRDATCCGFAHGIGMCGMPRALGRAEGEVDSLRAALTAEKAARVKAENQREYWRTACNSDAQKMFASLEERDRARAWAKAWKKAAKSERWADGGYQRDTDKGLLRAAIERAERAESEIYRLSDFLRIMTEEATRLRNERDEWIARAERWRRSEPLYEECDTCAAKPRDFNKCYEERNRALAERDEWKARAQGARAEALEEAAKEIDSIAIAPGKAWASKVRALAAKPEGGEP